MNILVVGNIFTGKSALLNKMIGKDVAEEAADAQYKGTIGVTAYDYSVNGVTGKFCDTPGLQDHEDGTDNDDKYIRDMKEQGCHKADIMLYCIKLSNTRFHEDDHKTIMNLTTGLGMRIWERAIFVLTFANDRIARLELKYSDELRPGQKSVREVKFKEIVSKWEKVLRTEIKNAGVSSKVAESIPVVPAGYEISDDLYLEAEDTNWIESLWHICEARKPQGMLEKLQKRKPFTSMVSFLRKGRRDDGNGGYEQTTLQARSSISEPQESPATKSSAERESSRTKQAEDR